MSHDCPPMPLPMVTRTIWGRGAAGAELPERLLGGTEVASLSDRTGRPVRVARSVSTLRAGAD